MKENVKMAGNSMKATDSLKMGNFAESDKLTINLPQSHICRERSPASLQLTDFWANPEIASNRRFVHIARTQRVQRKNDESRGVEL